MKIFGVAICNVPTHGETGSSGLQQPKAIKGAFGSPNKIGTCRFIHNFNKYLIREEGGGIKSPKLSATPPLILQHDLKMRI